MFSSSALNKSIKNAENLKDFDSALAFCRSFCKENLKELFEESNQVVVDKENLTTYQLGVCITDYAAFSQEALHFLVDSMVRNHDWPKLFEEIQHNINEEKGEETKGIPHLEIMREGYRKDLGLEVDFNKKDPSLVTQRFLKSMKHIFNSDDNAFSAGALLAFEGTAIQEFHILDAIVKAYHARTKNEENGLSKTLTSYYIDGHKLFEIGHEAHLIESIQPYITADNTERMIRGYLAVAITMNIWWKQLYNEAIHKECFEELLNFDVQLTSVKSEVGIA